MNWPTYICSGCGFDVVFRIALAILPVLLLCPQVSLTLLEAGPNVLPIFDPALQTQALETLTRRTSSELRAAGLITREFTNVRLGCGVKYVTEHHARC